MGDGLQRHEGIVKLRAMLLCPIMALVSLCSPAADAESAMILGPAYAPAAGLKTEAAELPGF